MCSCADDAELPEPEKKYYLTRKVSTSEFPGGQTLTIDLRYNYNEKKQLSSITGTNQRSGSASSAINILYSYDAQDRLVRIQYSPELMWDITYNEKNQVDKQIRTSKNTDNSTEIHYYKNSYSASGQRTSLQMWNIIDGAEVPGPIYTYTYTNGQVTFMHGELPTGGTYNNYTFVYDDKKVPLQGIYQLSVPTLIMQEIPRQILADHNLVAHSKTENYQGNNYSFEATYQYNDAGYPVSSIRLWHEGSIERINFTYEN